MKLCGNINVIVAGHGDMPAASFSVTVAVSEQQLQKEDLACIHNNANDEGKEQGSDIEDHDLQGWYGASLSY